VVLNQKHELIPQFVHDLNFGLLIIRLEIVCMISICILYVPNQVNKLRFVSDKLGTIQVDFGLSSLQQSLCHI
jgi:hypothetical protein